MSKEILFLFTKKFPYGHQETYLFDELPYLIEKFNKLIIVPYDEYEYNDDKNRINDVKGVDIFKINKKVKTFSLLQKLKREIAIISIVGEEIINGREKKKHIVRYRSICAQLRHAFSNAAILEDYLSDITEKNQKIIFYNYWLHRGVIISAFIKKRLSNHMKIVSRAHAYDLYHNDWLKMLNIKTDMFLPFEYFKINSCDHIFSISSHGLSHFQKLYGQFSSKFSIARLGVKDNLKQSDFVEFSDVKIIVSCSAIDYRKRVYMMPEILSKLDFKFKWIHIGGGSIDNIEKVETEIRKYNLKEVCELKGLMAHPQIIELYQTLKIDYFFNLSIAEGIPVSLMEAASFGIPMIATNTIGNPEIVNNENGFLIDVNFNSSDIAEKINRYNFDTENIKYKRNMSRQMFLSNYNASKNYKEFASLLSVYLNHD